MTPDRRESVFKADPWPAPLHLGASFAAGPATSESDRLGRQFSFERRINECIRANTQPAVMAQPEAAAPPPATPAAATRARRRTGA